MDTPDFEQIARRIMADYMASLKTMPADSPTTFVTTLGDQLRVIWNARGAADIAKIEHELAVLMGGNASGPYINNLARALRGLDR